MYVPLCHNVFHETCLPKMGLSLSRNASGSSRTVILPSMNFQALQYYIVGP